MALAALALITLYSSFDTRFTVYKPHPDWRSVAEYLGKEIDAGNGGMPVYTSTPNPRSLSYYDPRIQDVKNLTTELSPTEVGSKVREQLGAWFGRIAESYFKELDAHTRRLLANAQFVIRPSKPTPGELDWPARHTDRTCYVIRNEWHPNILVDGSVEALLAHQDTSVLQTRRFTGVTVYKVRIDK